VLRLLRYHPSVGFKLRIFLVLIAPLILIAGGYGVIRIRQQAAQLLDAERQGMAATARAFQLVVENVLRDRQALDIQQLVSEMVPEHAPIERIRIVDRSLALIASASEGRAEWASEERVRRVVDTGRPETAFEEPHTFVHLMPLRKSIGGVLGVVEIAFQSGAKPRVDRAILDTVVSLSVLTVILALLIIFVVQREVLRPLSLLAGSMRVLGEGQPGPPLPVRRRDEFGAVAEAFNRMAGQLEMARQRILNDSEHMAELEQQLRRGATLAVAGKLASSVAHEVGTPLNIISGRAEMLLRSLPAEDAGRADLQAIIEQIDRISGIIRSLLDTVRPQKPELEAVSLRPVVERLVPLLARLRHRDGISVVTDIPPDLPQIAADPGQLQQVLINLLMNAIEAVAPGGRVGVTARACARNDRPGVAAMVTDSGPGISPAVVGKIFEPFFTTKPMGQGTGLGLAICRDIAQSHAGALAVESRPGEGTTFTLWLPRHEARA